jgi:hypothetical protein
MIRNHLLHPLHPLGIETQKIYIQSSAGFSSTRPTQKLRLAKLFYLKEASVSMIICVRGNER